MADDTPTETTISARIAITLVDRLDTWVKELNAKRKDTPFNRTDLIRGLLTWGVNHRPDWMPNPQRDWESCENVNAMVAAIQCTPDTLLHHRLAGVLVQAYDPHINDPNGGDERVSAAWGAIRSYAKGQKSWDDVRYECMSVYRDWHPMVTGGWGDRTKDQIKWANKVSPIGMLVQHGVEAAINVIPVIMSKIDVDPSSEVKQSDLEFGMVRLREAHKHVCSIIRATFPMAPHGFEDTCRQMADSRLGRAHLGVAASVA